MLTVAAMLAGLAIIQFMVSPNVSAPALLASVGAIAFAFVGAMRLGCVDREGAAPAANAVGLAQMALWRAPATLAGALDVARAAFSADVLLKPALARVRMRPMSDLARATFANALSAAPGALVVETSADGFLLHVHDEDSLRMETVAAVEARAAAAIDGRAAS